MTQTLLGQRTRLLTGDSHTSCAETSNGPLHAQNKPKMAKWQRHQETNLWGKKTCISLFSFPQRRCSWSFGSGSRRRSSTTGTWLGTRWRSACAPSTRPRSRTAARTPSRRYASQEVCLFVSVSVSAPVCHLARAQAFSIKERCIESNFVNLCSICNAFLLPQMMEPFVPFYSKIPRRMTSVVVVLFMVSWAM